MFRECSSSILHGRWVLSWLTWCECLWLCSPACYKYSNGVCTVPTSASCCHVQQWDPAICSALKDIFGGGTPISFSRAVFCREGGAKMLQACLHRSQQNHYFHLCDARCTKKIDRVWVAIQFLICNGAEKIFCEKCTKLEAFWPNGGDVNELNGFQPCLAELVDIDLSEPLQATWGLWSWLINALAIFQTWWEDQISTTLLPRCMHCSWSVQIEWTCWQSSLWTWYSRGGFD